MAEPQPGRIPCPDCGAALALPIATVLAGQPIVCADCGLELHVNQADSQSALAALGRWYEETAAARAAAAAGRAESDSSVSRPHRRRPRR